ncbi:ABC transporter permease [bacterium]|nr:ABC transporter permease [bacterium]
MRGLLAHFWLTLKLNFRAPQAVVYGYLVPLFFLLAFGSVFQASQPPLLHEMGQLFTITILGGACFGMPTALVAERERGIWRQYRLLPVSTAALVVSTMLARAVLISLAVLMQVAVARVFYATPWPVHPAQTLVALMVVCWAFLGMGLVVAMAADTVAAVQALGQAIFLPMVMIGGVGVPLRALPGWAQHVAAFFPGRYAVEVFNATCLPEGAGLSGALFPLSALAGIGSAAFLAGWQMSRWDCGLRLRSRSRLWIGLALAAWLVVGLVAIQTGRTALPQSSGASWLSITPAQIESIQPGELPSDSDLVTPVAAQLGELSPRLRSLQQHLANGSPAGQGDPVQRTLNLLSVAAIFDICQDPDEARVAALVFELLQEKIAHHDLQRILVFLLLNPEQGRILTELPELGLAGGLGREVVRQRVELYALKLLKRLRQEDRGDWE